MKASLSTATTTMLGRLAALLALLGFIFAATASPPMAGFDPVGGSRLCHAAGGDQTVPSGESAEREECCLLCQVAQLAKGAVPAADSALAEPDARYAGPAFHSRETALGVSARHAQARAPPA